MPIPLKKIKSQDNKKIKPKSLPKDDSLDRLTLPIYNLEGQKINESKLDSKVFDGKFNEAALHQTIMMYYTNKRQGTASTKTRGEVSGGGRKPWRQKGTGRARAGSIRSPLWRHGGVIFGPHPRDYSYKLPKKIRELALKSSINAKLNENDMILVNEDVLNLIKTKQLIKTLKSLKITQSCLLVLDSKKNEILNASKNIPFLNMKLDKDINALDVLRNKKLVLTEKALINLIKRLKTR